MVCTVWYMVGLVNAHLELDAHALVLAVEHVRALVLVDGRLAW